MGAGSVGITLGGVVGVADGTGVAATVAGEVGVKVDVEVGIAVGSSREMPSSSVRQPGSEIAAPMPALHFRNCLLVNVRIGDSPSCAVRWYHRLTDP